MAQASPATGTEDLAERARLDQVFFALSDATRRDILRRLSQGPRLVKELAGPYEISMQAVSRHIQVLVRAGLVQQERTGRVSRCRLDAGPVYAAAVWLNQYADYWQTQFDDLARWLQQVDRKAAAEREDEGS